MAKNEAKIKFTAETKGFNEEIKKSRDEMGELVAELKLNEEQMKSSGKSVEGLEKRHKILSEQLQVSQKTQDALSQKVDKAAEIFGENSIEVTKLRTQLLNAQRAEEKIQQAISACNDELNEQRSAANKVETETEKLTKTIDEQQSELDRLKGEYIDVVLQYGETSDEARKLAREISDLSGELKQSKSAFADASGAADKLDQSLDDAGDAAKDSADGFTVAKGAIADLAADAVQAAIGKVSEFIDYLKELPEATREIRQDMATLETSFEGAGLSGEQATETWKEIYSVFGEEDRAVEAANHIARIADNQDELAKWTTITKGVYGQFQDSLDPAALAEASLETSKVGTVTGALADALNWGAAEGEKFGVTTKKNIDFVELEKDELEALNSSQRAEYEARKAQYEAIEEYNTSVNEATSAEDYFNIALSECTTEQERQQLITETLNSIYGDSAKAFEEASGAQIEAKDAAAETILIENELADAIEPVTTAWQGMKNELLQGILPVIETVTGWLKEHPLALKIIATTIGILTAAIGGLAIGVGIYTAVQWAMNAALAPVIGTVLLVAAAIAAVVAIIMICIEYWDEIVAAVKNCWEWIKETLSQWGTWIYENVIQPIADFFVGLWDGIVSGLESAWTWITELFSSVGTWIYENVIAPVAQFFTDLWNGIVNAWHTVIDPWIEIVKRLGTMFYENVIRPVAQFFTDLWNGIVNGLQAAWNWITDLCSTIANWVNSKIIQPVSNFFSSLWNGIKNGVKTAVNAVKNVFSTVANWVNSKVIQPVKNFFSNLWNGFKNGAKNAWEGVKSVFSKVGSFFSGVFKTVKDKILSVFSAGGKIFSGIKDGIVSVFKTVVNAIIKGLNKVIAVPLKGLNGILDSIANVSIVGIQPFSWLTWRCPIPQIPLLAKGGIVDQPTLNIAGEAGPEAIIPIDKLNGYIYGAVEKAMNSMNLSALASAVEALASRPVEVSVNGRQLALATAGDTDRVNGMRNRFTERGVLLD